MIMTDPSEVSSQNSGQDSSPTAEPVESVEQVFEDIIQRIGGDAVLLGVLTTAVDLLWRIGYRKAYLQFKK